MGEFAFILLTLFFVILIFLIVDKIITKYNREKKFVPHEDFSGELNNLDKIIEGVSMKDEGEEEQEEVEEDRNDENSDEEENEEISNKKQKTNKSNSLKNAMITKEILTPKHKKSN